MFEDKRVVIGGWIAAALLGFLGGAAVFWTPAPRVAVAPSDALAGTAGSIPAPQSAEPAGGALAGSPSAIPFSPVGAAPVTSPTSDAPAIAQAPLTQSTASTNPVGPATPAPLITINGFTLQGDTVVAAPNDPSDKRRRVRMSMDVSSIP